jgi:hypothetical protein
MESANVVEEMEAIAVAASKREVKVRCIKTPQQSPRNSTRDVDTPRTKLETKMRRLRKTVIEGTP